MESENKAATSEKAQIATFKTSSYPVPDTLDAIVVKEGTKIEKDQISMSVNYKVRITK